MKRRLVITAAALAAIHFVLSIGSVLTAFGAGMDAFDNPDHQASMVEQVADALAGILMQPGASLWTPWMSKNLPDVVEWGICVFNSLLWGMVLALALNARGLLKSEGSGGSGENVNSESRATES